MQNFPHSTTYGTYNIRFLLQKPKFSTMMPLRSRMNKNEQFVDFLKKNYKENIFYKKIRSILDIKINPVTIKKLIETKEDIDYLFRIRDRKTLHKIRNSLRIIFRNGSPYEKQIIGYILGKNIYFDNPFVAIACHTYFGFIRRHRPKISNYRFRNFEDKFVFAIYWHIYVKREHVETLKFDTRKIDVRSIYVLLYSTGSDYLIEDIVDRFKEDQDVFTNMINHFAYGHVYLGHKLLKMPRHDKLLISRMGFDKTIIVMYYFTNSAQMFLKERKETLYYDNMGFNELCIEAETSQPDIVHSGLKKRSVVTKDLVKNIKLAWLRIFLVSDHFLFFLEVFEEIDPDASLEYKILRKIQNILSGKAVKNIKTLLKNHVSFKETNKYATIEMTTVLKHLNVI